MELGMLHPDLASRMSDNSFMSQNTLLFLYFVFFCFMFHDRAVSFNRANAYTESVSVRTFFKRL